MNPPDPSLSPPSPPPPGPVLVSPLEPHATTSVHATDREANARRNHEAEPAMLQAHH
jgi:hypothetical protein